jgi:hypothetical protein
MVTREYALKLIQEAALAEFNHRGAAMIFEHVAARFPEWPAQLIAEGCELAGYPVGDSTPEDVIPR